jgi:hypothetical protein
VELTRQQKALIETAAEIWQDSPEELAFQHVVLAHLCYPRSRRRAGVQELHPNALHSQNPWDWREDRCRLVRGPKRIHYPNPRRCQCLNRTFRSVVSYGLIFL